MQSRLIDVGSSLASLTTSEDIDKLNHVKFDEMNVERLEEYIDRLDQELPVLTQFILPSGGESSSRFHMARSICRRAERSIVALNERQEVSSSVLKFMNRLSDLLFVLARTSASRDGHIEKTYKKERIIVI